MDQNFRRLIDTLAVIPANRKASSSEILERLRGRRHEVTSRTLENS